MKFANCHMIDYFTNNLYERHIPADIRKEVAMCGFGEVINSILDNKIKTTKLQNFIKNTNSFALHNLTEVCLHCDNLHDFLNTGANIPPSLGLKVFMNPKKSHEVEILSSIIATIREVSKSTHLIDIGDGKGYLSSMLALQHNIPVLGIDASPVNTKGAMERAEKVQKAWKHILKYPTKSLPPKDQCCLVDNQLYKQETLYVNEGVDLRSLVSRMFDEEVKKCGLSGLHTCGNLASTCIKVYNKHDYIKSICNVGCCYHLLTEQYEGANTTAEFGFPLSDHLRKKKFVLGRQARMLASQSIDRILAYRQVDNKIVFYRALFQILLEKHHPNSLGKQIKRLKKPCENFVEYVEIASRRINVHFDMSKEEIHEFYLQYKDREMELNLFYLLRAFLAQIIECVILLDRLLFLVEQGNDHSVLVQLFDRVLSPRCYGVISLKNECM